MTLGRHSVGSQSTRRSELDRQDGVSIGRTCARERQGVRQHVLLDVEAKGAVEDLERQLSLHNSLKLASCVGVPMILLKSIVGEFYKMSWKNGIDLAESGVCPLYSSTDQFGPGVKKLVKAPCAMQYCPKNGVLTHCARNGLHGNIHGAELREELSHLTFTVFECGVCNSLFLFDWHFLDATMINVSTSPLECSVCGFRVMNEVALAAHFFFVHLSNLNL